jgi:hypothetical protein
MKRESIYLRLPVICRMRFYRAASIATFAERVDGSPHSRPSEF